MTLVHAGPVPLDMYLGFMVGSFAMLLAFVLLLAQDVTVPAPNIPEANPQVIAASASVLPSAPPAIDLLAQDVIAPPPGTQESSSRIVLANALPSAPSSINGTAEPSPEPFRAVLDVTSANTASADSLIEPVRPAKLGKPLPASSKRVWLALTIAQHSAATFDAWTTREKISSGRYHEGNSLLKPFAGNSSLYAAMQITPAVFDLLGHRMRHSDRPWLRRMWWLPQTAQTGAHLAFGAMNLTK